MTNTGTHSYSTTASENVQANTGVNWDEGMSPAAVNNSARQNMADLRGRLNDEIWFQYGVGSKDVRHTYVSGTQTTLAGVDATAAWQAGRRVKAVGSSTGTIYGSVASSSFGTGTNTINYTWDSGSLSNEALSIYLSQAPVTGGPIAETGLSHVPGKPYLHINRTNNLSISQSTLTKIQYDTVVVDTGAYWDATNFRYTPLIPGRYSVYANTRITCSGATAQNAALASANIKLTGTTKVSNQANAFVAKASGTTDVESAVYYEAQLNGSSDYIECFAYSDDSSPVIAGAATRNFMIISRIGP